MQNYFNIVQNYRLYDIEYHVRCNAIKYYKILWYKYYKALFYIFIQDVQLIERFTILFLRTKFFNEELKKIRAVLITITLQFFFL